jgi:hypothetical protein
MFIDHIEKKIDVYFLRVEKKEEVGTAGDERGKKNIISLLGAKSKEQLDTFYLQ